LASTVADIFASRHGAGFRGIVKEYAVDLCATLFREADITHGLINRGDIRLIDPRGNGQPWIVGIAPTLTC